MRRNGIIPIVSYAVEQHIDYIQVSIDNFTLGAVDCHCTVWEYDAQKNLLNYRKVYIAPEEYAEWGTRDEYIVELVLDKLGYERRRDASLVHFPA